MANFNLPFGVYVSNNNPLDASRYAVSDLTERGNLITLGRAYEGMQTYVASQKKLYILKSLSPVYWEQVPDASSLESSDASINDIYVQLENMDSSIDSLWTKVDGSLNNIDSSLGDIWVKLGYVDISLNNIDFSALEASINDIWIKIDSIDISLNDIYINLGNLDASVNAVYIKTNYLDTSIQAIDLKNTNQDSSINSIWNKIGNQDSSFNLFVAKAGDTMTGVLNISSGLHVTNDVSIGGNLYANNLTVDGSSIFNGSSSFLGDVFFEGSAYFVDVNTLEISTGFLELNTGLVGPPPLTLQSGIIVKRGSENPYVFVYDEDIQTFRIGISFLETSTHYSDASTQAVATREDNPSEGYIGYWSSSENMFRFRSPESIADVSMGYVNTQIGYLESSINDIYDYLDGTETVSRTIYIDSSLGNDTTGNGSQSSPFASYLRAIKDIKPYVNENVAIIIDVSAGTYNVDMIDVDKYFNKIYFSRNSSFLVNGKFVTDVSGLTISASATQYIYNVTGATFTSNQYQDYFMTNGTTDFPIVYNDPSIIYSNVGATGCTSVIHNTTTFVLTNGNFFLNCKEPLNGQTFEFHNIDLQSSSGAVRFSNNSILDLFTSKITATQGSTTISSFRNNFNSCAFVLTSSGWTNDCPKVQFKQSSIRKSGTKTGTGLTENQNYTIQLTASFGLYLYNWTTAIACQAGFFISNLVNGAMVFDNNTNGISIRNATNFTIGQNTPLYIKDVSTLLTNGETLFGNYIVAINSLVGTPTSYASSAISALGYTTPSKNISVNIPGITQAVTFPNGTTQTSSYDASVNTIWTKISQIDTSIVNSDSSMWTKFGYVDTSLNNIWVKLGQVDNSLNNVETGVAVYNWDTSSGIINIDMSTDKRIKLILNGNATFNLTNLSSAYSRTVMIDVKAVTTTRTITWDASLTTNNWADGDVLSLIDPSTYAFVLNINTAGNDKSDVFVNWIKKGL